MKKWLLIFTALMAISGFAGEEAPAKTAKENKAETTETNTKSASTNADGEDSKIDPMVQAMQVLGSREQARTMPGSAHYLSKADLEKHQHTDIHRILRDVPGVYMQEEDGMGLRPNIGFRGTGVERSQKITLMEDGVLIAPAPYTAPAAYYFPTAGRMESVEVMKGPSTITQGPYTNGGSLNMVSSSIPGDFSSDISAGFGSNNLYRLKANVGDSGERFGWLVETFQMDGDGFKDLDGGGDTGTELNDYMAKLRFNSSENASIYQSLELKVGKTTQFGNETYLGLTEADFAADPLRRYAGSQLDYIDTDHKQAQLTHYIQPSSNFDITTTVYFNDYWRNWHKMEKTLGVSNSTILANPDEYAEHLAILRGDIDSEDDALRIRNNNRNYESKGIQSTLTSNFATGSANHELSVSFRIHEDEEDRLQNEEEYRMVSRVMSLTSEGAPGSQTNRLSSAEAFSAYIADTITAGDWTFRPGLRYETIDYERIDYLKTDPSRAEEPSRIRENGVDVFLPGLGIDYQIGNGRVFFGVYRGFSPPGAGKNEDTEEEESTNYEFGFRHDGARFASEVIVFNNDYDNLLGAETVSGGGGEVGELFNGGEVLVQGLEATLNGNLYEGAGFKVPFSASYTYTTTEFKSSFDTSFADWGPSVVEGDELPYIPEQQLHLNLGYDRENFTLNFGADYTSEMRTKAGQGAIPSNEGTDSRWVFDLAADYSFNKTYKVFAQVRNLFDETYIVSRRPYGLRPGLNRNFVVGARANF